MVAANRRNRRYWLRLAGFFLLTLSISLISLPFLLGVLSTLALLYAPCAGPGPNPADEGYQAESVTLQARAGGSFQGYFIHGRNGATIIVPPTGSSGRGSRWAETKLLLDHGYAVFTFESRRCAGMGPLSLGYEEVNEVADALGYLHTRPEVDRDRIGIYGFSSAGATAVMAAARLPGLKAVVAEGGYGDFVKNALGASRSRGLTGLIEAAYRRPFRPTYRLVTGLELEQLSPVSVIDRIAPRPILLIYGSQEVSLAGAREQLAAAGDNAELWIVDGAGHGNYLAVAPEEYEARLVGFFQEALGK